MPAKPKTKFVIDRKKWYRGKDDAMLLLENNSRQMCCLGHVALGCGLKPKDICGIGTPVEVECGLRQKLPAFLLNFDTVYPENSSACDRAMEINDNMEITDREREKQLKALFKKHGATLTFIN